MGTRSFLGILATALFAALASDASAASIQGVWRTAPDDKGQSAFVTVTPCGATFCGTITQVLNPAGQKIAHPNTGRKILKDMKPVTENTYAGMTFVPKHNRDYVSTVSINGAKMALRACLGPVCQTQTWTRAK